MQKQFLLSGFGGQGVMFAGQLLAYAAMHEQREVTWIPSYGPEMRGGTAHCFVVISDQPIGSPIVKHPQVALIFNNPSFAKYEPVVSPGGFCVVNTSLVTQPTQRTDITHLMIPATEIADGLGEARLANVVMLGAVLAAYPALALDSIRGALEAHIPPHRRGLLASNFAALDRGALAAAQPARS